MDYERITELFFDDFSGNEDNTRRYATAAFRFYAMCGKPLYSEAAELVRAAAAARGRDCLTGIRGGIAKPVEQELINAERLMAEKAPMLDDIRAVEETLRILCNKKCGYDILKALEYVYFAHPGEKQGKGDVAARVAQASIQIPASERQIYYWLREARTIFCRVRGLRN